MAYMIGDGCLQCGACEASCENRAIAVKGSGYEIDPSRCTECVGVAESQQCFEVCPIELPGPDPDHEETREELLERWKQLHLGQEPR
jgi:ferredoxin